MKNANLGFNKDTSVLFATFSLWANGKRMPTNGSVEPLRDFLVPKIKKLVLIDQLVPGGEDVAYKIEVYTNGNMKCDTPDPSWWYAWFRPWLTWTNRNGTQISFKIRDFLSVVDWPFRTNTTYDYLIGLESINALAGILLRHFGKVRKVVYYVSDYSPARYPNKLFNALYLALDRYCARHADYIWDVSDAMQKARIAAGLDPQTSAPVIHVANGLFPDQIIPGHPKQNNIHALAYMGTVGPENGPDVAIEALAIVRKKYSDAVLHMIGGKPSDFAWLLPIIKKLDLERVVIHHGFVPKAADMAKIMNACSIGLAPYRAISGSPRYYGDAGKIRAYAGAGLPIICSSVPPLGKEAAEQGAAIVTNDDAQSIAKMVMQLFSDSEYYTSLQKNARKFAKNNTWENQFISAFTRMK